MDLASSPTEYKVFEIDATGSGRVLASVTDAPPAYLHSLFSTENYLILIVWQADYIATEKPTYNILDSMKSWDSSRKTLFCESDLGS
jgi:torulene dioxygenase